MDCSMFIQHVIDRQTDNGSSDRWSWKEKDPEQPAVDG